MKKKQRFIANKNKDVYFKKYSIQKDRKRGKEEQGRETNKKRTAR